ncbi:hypothetical protein LAB52_08140 [Lactobacillus amylovorus GRL1118]|nr:hypothetical protein LAB52_08140 [Lactobacillus amylovorus GRL1118]
MNKKPEQRKNQQNEKSTCKREKKLVTYLNVVKQEMNNSSG